MKTKITGLVLGVLLTPIALFLAVVSGGAGHGDYVLARILFPLSILVTHVTESIGVFGIAIACVQFPLYSWLLASAYHQKKKAPLLLIAGIHVILVGFAFAFSNGYSR